MKVVHNESTYTHEKFGEFWSSGSVNLVIYKSEQDWIIENRLSKGLGPSQFHSGPGRCLNTDHAMRTPSRNRGPRRTPMVPLHQFDAAVLSSMCGPATRPSLSSDYKSDWPAKIPPPPRSFSPMLRWDTATTRRRLAAISPCHLAIPSV
jgi:hypothetical protein